MLQTDDASLGRYPIGALLSVGYDREAPRLNAQVKVTNGKVTRSATVQQVVGDEVYVRLR